MHLQLCSKRLAFSTASICSHDRFLNFLSASGRLAFSIAPDHWEEGAQDRTYWRYSVHKGAQQCKAIRTAAAQKASVGQ